MQPQEAQMMKVKYSSIPFAKMRNSEFKLHLDKLMLLIHAITGWKLPANEAINIMLTDQLGKRIREKYNNSNPDEIEYAFRTYGSTVKDYGKDFNLSLFDTVMQAYIADREEVSRIEEQYTAKKLAIAYRPTPDTVKSMRRQVVEERYQAFLNGQASFGIQPVDGIETLAADNFCEPDIYADFLIKAMETVRAELVKDREAYLMKGKTSQAAAIQQQIDRLTSNHEKVVILAKKIALVFCFYKFKEAGYKTIYKQEN
jgi:hypothetical protein